MLDGTCSNSAVSHVANINISLVHDIHIHRPLLVLTLFSSIAYAVGCGGDFVGLDGFAYWTFFVNIANSEWYVISI